MFRCLHSFTCEGCNEVTADVKTKLTKVRHVLQRWMTPLDTRGSGFSTTHILVLLNVTYKETTKKIN